MDEIALETIASPETGQVLVRDVRPFEVRYKDRSVVVNLSGYYPRDSGHDEDAVFVGNDMAPADEALKLLRRQVDGTPSPQAIKDFRTKLRLSQREAGALLKVGENAFDKYERGLVEPSGPTVQLMTLLQRHPELLDELR